MKAVTSLLLGLMFMGHSPIFSQTADTLAARKVLDVACQRLDSSDLYGSLDTALVAMRLNAGVSASLDYKTAVLLDSLGKRFAVPKLRLYEPARISLYNASLLWRRLKTERSMEFARSVHNMGVALRGLGEYKKALAAFTQAKNIRVALFGENSGELVRSYNAIGVVESDLGRYKESLVAYEKSAQISIRLNGGSEQNLDGFNFHMNMGGVYYEMKKLRDAAFHFERARSIVPYLQDIKRLEASLYNNLGSLYMSMKDYAKAIQYHEQALALRLELFGELHPSVASSYSNLGSAYTEINNLPQALKFNLKALEIKERLSNISPPDLALSYRNLGDIYGLMGDSLRPKCMEYYEKAEQIFVEHNTERHVYTASIRGNIAAVYKEMNRYDESIAKYRQCLNNFVDIGGPTGPDLQWNLINLSLVHKQMGNLPLALRTLDTVLTNIGWPAHPDSIDSDQRFNLFEALLFKGEILASMAKSPAQRTQPRELLAQAVDLAERYREGLSGDDSRSNFTQLVKRAIESSIRLEMSAPKRDDAQLRRVYELAAKNKAFLLYEAVVKADALLAKVPPQLARREAELRTDIAYYEQLRYRMEQSDSTDDQQAARRYAAEAFRLRQEHEAFLAEHSTYFGQKDPLPVTTVSFVQDSLLASDQSWLEYFVGDSATYIFVIQKKAFAVVPVKNDFSLDAAVRGMLHGIYAHFMNPQASNDTDDLIRTARLYCDNAVLIYQKVLAPVDSLLSQRVVVVPDGMLAYLPFDALLMSAPRAATRFVSHAYWGQQRIVSYAHSANMLYQMQRKRHVIGASAPEAAVAAAFSDGRSKVEQSMMPNGWSVASRDSLGTLETSGDEARWVAQRFSVSPLLSTQANKSTLLPLLEQCPVIHLTTHGVANFKIGDFAYLALGVTDQPGFFEKLYAKEIYNHISKANIVVLSACQTNTGEMRLGEGVISLGRAFAYAGAKSVVTTLWSVDDKQTFRLMQHFYDNLLEEKPLPKDEALWQARQRYLREVANGGANQALYAHPFYWASFVPLGDMAPLR